MQQMDYCNPLGEFSKGIYGAIFTNCLMDRRPQFLEKSKLPKTYKKEGRRHSGPMDGQIRSPPTDWKVRGKGQLFSR